MKLFLMLLCFLIVTACTQPAPVDHSSPTMPESSQTAQTPDGYVQWCAEHHEDKGCPKQ